ncbi:MAG: hypothetical protein ACXWV2_11230 [Chitinophagaceae bacterium]
MFEPTSIIGQWAGFFEYGPDYGSELHGEKVNFRLYIDIYIDGQFLGHSVDIEGVGADFQKARVRGFVDGHFISFTKDYPHYHGFDEQNNLIENFNQRHPGVHYEGTYNRTLKSFTGNWEIETEIETIGDKTYLDIATGKWEMVKDDL